MNSYLLHFIAYTFAMIGFIVVALFIYKKATYSTPQQKDKNFLIVENSLKLAPTKTVYVIKAGNERFLVAGDSANTTMLAKLNDRSNQTSIKENIMDIPELTRQVQRVNRG